MTDWTQKPWFLPLMRHMSGLGPRPKDCPKPAPHGALDLHDRWKRWMGNPKVDWRTTPLWARRLRHEVLAARKPQVTPPPASVPPVQRPKPRMPLPHAMTAWGYASGELNGQKAVQKALACGARSVSVQRNAGVAPADVQALQAACFAVYLWDDPSTKETPYDPDAVKAELARLGIPAANYMPQDESNVQRQHAINYRDAGIPVQTIVGTLGGPAPAELADCDYLVEAYAPLGHPFDDLNRMTWQAEHDGWRTATPVLGCWGGVQPTAHLGLDSYRDQWGLWLLETATPGDLDYLGGLTRSAKAAA